MQSHVDSILLVIFISSTLCTNGNEVDAHFSGLDRKIMTETQPAAFEIPHRKVKEEEEERVNIIPLCQENGKKKMSTEYSTRPHVFTINIFKVVVLFFSVSWNTFQTKSDVRLLGVWLRADIRDRWTIQQEQCYFHDIISDEEAKSYHNPIQASLDAIGKGAPLSPLAQTRIWLLYSAIKYELCPFHTVHKERGLVQTKC